MGGWIVLLAGFVPDNSQNPRIFFVCAHVSTSGSTPEMYSSKNTTMPLPEIEPELLFWAESALPTTSLQLRLHMCVRAHVCVCVCMSEHVCVYTQRTNVCTQQFRHNFSSSESSRFVASAPAACVRSCCVNFNQIQHNHYNDMHHSEQVKSSHTNGA